MIFFGGSVAFVTSAHVDPDQHHSVKIYFE